MTDATLAEIRLTPEFQRRLRNLAKKYRQIQTDLAPILEQLQLREFLLVILLDIYSKSEQQDIEIESIRQIIKGVDLPDGI